MTPTPPGMLYTIYDSFEDLPKEGPGILRYAPFESLGCRFTYLVPMMNRKVLCAKVKDENGTLAYMHMGCPYSDLAQRWLEEALADLGDNRAWVSSLEIHESITKSRPTTEQPKCR